MKCFIEVAQIVLSYVQLKRGKRSRKLAYPTTTLDSVWKNAMKISLTKRGKRTGSVAVRATRIRDPPSLMLFVGSLLCLEGFLRVLRFSFLRKNQLLHSIWPSAEGEPLWNPLPIPISLHIPIHKGCLIKERKHSIGY